jgi:hypothetical protein
MGSAPHVRPVNALIWVVALVCLLAAAIMAVFRQILAAEIAFGCAAVAVLVALIHLRVVVGGKPLGGSRMLGRGPYSQVACGPSHALVQKLRTTLASSARPPAKGTGRSNGSRSTNRAARPRRPTRKAASPTPSATTAAASRTS